MQLLQAVRAAVVAHTDREPKLLVSLGSLVALGDADAKCDFTHPFATNGSIRLPRVKRKALYFDPAKTLPEGKCKQQLAESTVTPDATSHSLVVHS